MKLGKAIEVNQSLLDGTYDHRDKELEDALKLGIEALKRLSGVRERPTCWAGDLLPGETKD